MRAVNLSAMTQSKLVSTPLVFMDLHLVCYI